MLGKNLIQAAAGNAAGEVLGVEDVFSTWLYTGNGSTQTITNGIDLAGEGGLVWIKGRSTAYDHVLYDSERPNGATNFYELNSNTTDAQTARTNAVNTFSSTGFSVGDLVRVNNNGTTYASWTFRKAEKFFDVVTYTGDNTTGRTVAHSLGSVPGFIIIKNITDGTVGWYCYHRSLGASSHIILNQFTASNNSSVLWNSTSPTSSVFTLTGNNLTVNQTGSTYVAYLFAHDAGGFGDGGTESVIKCGSFTTTGGGTLSVNLGWEPQFVIYKRTDSSGSWIMLDTMRVWSQGDDYRLFTNTSGTEGLANEGAPTATGFDFTDPVAGYTYIYIAIRRGPMKTPEDATEVFSAIAASGSTGTSRSIGFPSDFVWARRRDFAYTPVAIDRLRGYSATSGGSQPALETTNTGAENPFTTALVYDVWNDTAKDGALLGSTSSALWYHFRRAPGFFDVVAYTGDGSSTRDVSHSLGVVPEWVIIKNRSYTGGQWLVGAPTNQLNVGNGFDLSSTGGLNGDGPTQSVGATSFRPEVNSARNNNMNYSGDNFIAYLFATCPGVSKVGSYTGTGTTLNVDCGFASGARFVLIKRTDSTGDWYVWDTARGIVSGDDPYLLLNSTAAEVTNTDYIDPLSSGFQISSTAPAAINASGGSFIFLAIA